MSSSTSSDWVLEHRVANLESRIKTIEAERLRAIKEEAERLNESRIRWDTALKILMGVMIVAVWGLAVVANR